MPPQRISVSPDPATRGKDITIEYDFSGGATSPVTLTLNWDPPPDQQVTLSSASPTKVVTTPSNAIDCIIEDQSGQSADYGLPVYP